MSVPVQLAIKVPRGSHDLLNFFDSSYLATAHGQRRHVQWQMHGDFYGGWHVPASPYRNECS
eukprot:m.298476 g.298476  ORF g.298476 m.298476 type:complete len:62 (-) comp20091_c0_seq44:1727-1912(-)